METKGESKSKLFKKRASHSHFTLELYRKDDEITQDQTDQNRIHKANNQTSMGFRKGKSSESLMLHLT